MALVTVEAGSVVDVECDALITTINGQGRWAGAIDRAIMQSAGHVFHEQAANASPFTEGQTIVARGPTENPPPFKNVVFVVDNLQLPLRQIVLAGLQAADKAGFMLVSLPTMHMGTVLELVGQTKDEIVLEMVAGIKEFLANARHVIIGITIVVYGDHETEQALASHFD